MENNSFSFFPFQEDDQISFTCPDFTIWDASSMNHLSYPGNFSQIVDQWISFGDDTKGKMPQKSHDDKEIKLGATNSNQEVHKKVMHREIERQRRQEMATLYTSLRSVIPPQLLKGKRSISDQIQESAKYIRRMQNNIKELGIKRDNIKRLSKKESPDTENGSCSKISPISVIVQPCSVGVEILINGDFMPEGLNGLPLSRILQLVLEEGLVLVCCNWTKFDGRLHYAIQSEVPDYPGIDLQMLQTKLNGLINGLIDFNQ